MKKNSTTLQKLSKNKTTAAAALFLAAAVTFNAGCSTPTAPRSTASGDHFVEKNKDGSSAEDSQAPDTAASSSENRNSGGFFPYLPFFGGRTYLPGSSPNATINSNTPAVPGSAANSISEGSAGARGGIGSSSIGGGA